MSEHLRKADHQTQSGTTNEARVLNHFPTK